MSISDKKEKVFGKIAASRTLTESKFKSKLKKLSPFINNVKSVIAFLTDVIKALIGYGALVKAVIDILMHSLDTIEQELKKALKLNIKNIISCGINPSLPDFIKSTGDGIAIEVRKLDFFDLMKVDPKSISGKLLYNDVTPSLFDSTDFNTFLYAVIQDEGNTHTWKNIYDVKFLSIDPNGIHPNNSIIIKANSTYDNKSLNDLNNNYIDTLKLFNTEHLTNKIIDSIFGSVSVNLNKTKKQLENEAKIDAIVDKMINNDIGQTIDDSYFEFDNDELTQVEYVADNRQRGVIKIKTSEEFDASVDQSLLTNFNDEMGRAVTIQERKDILAKHLNEMADANTKNSNNPSDNITIKLDFTQNIINSIIKAIVGVVLTPKVIVLFLIIYKIIYGENIDFKDAIQFLKQNKQLFNGIIKKITGLITSFLLRIVLKYIGELMASEVAQRQLEKIEYRKNQLLSLVGVSQDAIKELKFVQDLGQQQLKS